MLEGVSPLSLRWPLLSWGLLVPFAAVPGQEGVGGLVVSRMKGSGEEGREGRVH